MTTKKYSSGQHENFSLENNSKTSTEPEVLEDLELLADCD